MKLKTLFWALFVLLFCFGCQVTVQKTSCNRMVNKGDFETCHKMGKKSVDYWYENSSTFISKKIGSCNYSKASEVGKIYYVYKSEGENIEDNMELCKKSINFLNGKNLIGIMGYTFGPLGRGYLGKREVGKRFKFGTINHNDSERKSYISALVIKPKEKDPNAIITYFNKNDIEIYANGADITVNKLITNSVTCVALGDEEVNFDKTQTKGVVNLKITNAKKVECEVPLNANVSTTD